VWYPYYVPWFVAVVLETPLVVVPNFYRPPKSSFDIATIAIQAVRIATFITLISLYFGLRNDQKQYENPDTERQSLLRKKLAPKQGSEDSATLGNGYGATTTENGAQTETADNSSDTDSEDSWLANCRTAEEKIANRLEQDGNWFTYAKGFAVSEQSFELNCRLASDLPPRSSSLMFGRSTTKLCNSEEF
jgi:hypothetical protein